MHTAVRLMFNWIIMELHPQVGTLHTWCHSVAIVRNIAMEAEYSNSSYWTLLVKLISFHMNQPQLRYGSLYSP